MYQMSPLGLRAVGQVDNHRFSSGILKGVRKEMLILLYADEYESRVLFHLLAGDPNKYSTGSSTKTHTSSTELASERRQATKANPGHGQADCRPPHQMPYRPYCSDGNLL
jgi:hypothetical protein